MKNEDFAEEVTLDSQKKKKGRGKGGRKKGHDQAWFRKSDLTLSFLVCLSVLS